MQWWLRYVVMAEATGADAGGAGGNAGSGSADVGGGAESSASVGASTGSGPARDASGRFTAADPSPTPEGGSLLDWRSTLPSELREAPTVQQYKSLHDAMKGLVEKDKLIGASIRLPEKSWADDPKSWESVFKRLGRPDDPTGYELTFAEDADKGIVVDPERKQQFLEEAHALGLTPWQAQALVNLQARWEEASRNLAAAEEAQQEITARQELGKTFGANVPALLQKAQNFFEFLGQGAFGGEHGQRAWQKLLDKGLGNDVDVLAAFANAYERLGEGDFYDADLASAGPVTVESVTQRAKELEARKMDAHYGRPGAQPLTPAEERELARAYDQQARLQERAGRR